MNHLAVAPWFFLKKILQLSRLREFSFASKVKRELFHKFLYVDLWPITNSDFFPKAFSFSSSTGSFFGTPSFLLSKNFNHDTKFDISTRNYGRKTYFRDWKLDIPKIWRFVHNQYFPTLSLELVSFMRTLNCRIQT